ncbi:hypothetical protein BD626DRAFT_42494 [Schizophyllum amplum]|uniref:Uncharacterized protein n=1 Tax=Schizophyllum amplum TaxID=97359 RepID=A0A550CDK1_9AGAR|nr:hypothetical protein BD626DRAFT_42494 [Auriculariopsis ampla]
MSIGLGEILQSLRYVHSLAFSFSLRHFTLSNGCSLSRFSASLRLCSAVCSPSIYSEGLLLNVSDCAGRDARNVLSCTSSSSCTREHQNVWSPGPQDSIAAGREYLLRKRVVDGAFAMRNSRCHGAFDPCCSRWGQETATRVSDQMTGVLLHRSMCTVHGCDTLIIVTLQREPGRKYVPPLAPCLSRISLHVVLPTTGQPSSLRRS